MKEPLGVYAACGNRLDVRVQFGGDGGEFSTSVIRGGFSVGGEPFVEEA